MEKKYYSIFFVAIVFIILFLLGHPRPMIDDLFFIGPSLNLYSNNDFTNPLLGRQNFPIDNFYLHPPLHAYMYFTWLKIFGVSTPAIISHQILLYVIISVSCIYIIRHYNLPSITEYLQPLIVTSTLISLGLRAEPLSVALTLSGFAIILLHSSNKHMVFPGLMLIIAGASAASRLALFSACFLIYSIVYILKRNKSSLALVLIQTTMAFLSVIFVLSFMINFNYLNFWYLYRLHASARVSENLYSTLSTYFSHTISITHIPSILFGIIALLYLIHFWKIRASPIYLCEGIFVTFMLLIVLGWIGHGAVWYMLFMASLVFGYIYNFMKQQRYIYRLILNLLIITSFLLPNSKLVLRTYGELFNHIRSDHNGRIIRESLKDLYTNQSILVDASSARYVFDYNLPKNAYDWSFAAQFPKMLATSDDIDPNDIYVLGPSSVEILNKQYETNIRLSKWKPLWINRWSFQKYPYYNYVFFVENDIKYKP